MKTKKKKYIVVVCLLTASLSMLHCGANAPPKPPQASHVINR